MEEDKRSPVVARLRRGILGWQPLWLHSDNLRMVWLVGTSRSASTQSDLVRAGARNRGDTKFTLLCPVRARIHSVPQLRSLLEHAHASSLFQHPRWCQDGGVMYHPTLILLFASCHIVKPSERTTCSTQSRLIALLRSFSYVEIAISAHPHHHLLTVTPAGLYPSSEAKLKR